MKTTKAKHTPGPWIIDRIERHSNGGLVVEQIAMIASIERQGLRVAEVKGDADDPRHAADARLIAAAPEQNEALIELLACFETRCLRTGANEREERACKAAREAIRKAEGREA